MRNKVIPLTESQRVHVASLESAAIRAEWLGSPVTFAYVSREGKPSEVSGVVTGLIGTESGRSALVTTERGTRTFNLTRVSDWQGI